LNSLLDIPPIRRGRTLWASAASDRQPRLIFNTDVSEQVTVVACRLFAQGVSAAWTSGLRPAI